MCHHQAVRFPPRACVPMPVSQWVRVCSAVLCCPAVLSHACMRPGRGPCTKMKPQRERKIGGVPPSTHTPWGDKPSGIATCSQGLRNRKSVRERSPEREKRHCLTDRVGRFRFPLGPQLAAQPSWAKRLGLWAFWLGDLVRQSNGSSAWMTTGKSKEKGEHLNPKPAR